MTIDRLKASLADRYRIRRFLVVSRDAANTGSQLVRIENVPEELRRRKP